MAVGLGMPSGDSRLYNVARFALTAFAIGCVLLFTIFSYRLAIYEPFNDKFEKLNELPYSSAGGEEDGEVADGEEREEVQTLYRGQSRALQYVFFCFGAPFLAAMAMLLHEALPAGNPKWNAAVDNVKMKATRVAVWPVPGRRFWLWWCGGLNLAELCFCLAYVGATISWVQEYLAPRYARYDALEQGMVLQGEGARYVFNLGSYALGFGLALYPCFLFLFWPCSHNSFVNYLLGIPWQAMIKYHRWMGHWTITVMGLHGVLFYLQWALQHEFWKEFTDWTDSVAFLPGSIAWFCALALQLTSLYHFRRQFFEIFYRVHIIMFVGVILFGTIHYYYSWTYILPGLVPYFVDCTFRIAQAANLTTISASTITDDQSMTSFELTVDKDVKTCPLQDIFVNIPSFDPWQWHPFTVADRFGSTIVMHTKRYGRFTKEMIANLATGSPLPVRVMGPDGGKPHGYWDKYRTLVCIVGGIGISPILGALNDMVRKRREGKKSAIEKVYIVWSSRHKAEFTVLNEDFLAEATAEGPDKWLELELHYTGTHLLEATSVHPAKHTHKTIADLKSVGDSSSDFTDGSDGSDVGMEGDKAGRPLPSELLAFRWMSSLGFSQARPVQPKVLNHWQEAAAILLGYLGCITCISVTYCYYAEPATAGIFGRLSGYKYWKLGALLITAGMVGALGLPAFATHTVVYWRYFRDTRCAAAGCATGPVNTPDPADFHVDASQVRAAKAGKGNKLAKTVSGFVMEDLAPAKRYAATLVGAQVGIVESELLLDIHARRPDIPGLLARVSDSLNAAGDHSDVGVLVGGPIGMVNAAQDAVSAINGWKGPFFHFHKLTEQM